MTKGQIVFRLLAALAFLKLTNYCESLVVNKFMINTPFNSTHLLCACELKTLIPLVELIKYLNKTTVGAVK